MYDEDLTDSAEINDVTEWLEPDEDEVTETTRRARRSFARAIGHGRVRGRRPVRR